jgi:hypothetical protein
LLLAYAAKKRSEAAPGVGKQTDVVVIGPRLAETIQVEERHVKELDVIYQASRRANAKAIKKAQNETKTFVEAAGKYYEEKRAQRSPGIVRAEDADTGQIKDPN